MNTKTAEVKGDSAATGPTPTNEKTRTELLAETVQRSPIYAAVVPMEASLGFPIPQIGSDEKVYLTFPVVGKAQQTGKEGNITVLFPPSMELTVSWLNGRLVSYRDYRFDNPFGSAVRDDPAPIAMLPHPGLAGLSPAEYRQQIRRLYQHYDILCSSLTERVDLPPFHLREFGEALQRLIAPELLDYYKTLAPLFFESMLQLT